MSPAVGLVFVSCLTYAVWRRRWPVLMNLAVRRQTLCLDTSSCRMLTLAELAHAIPRSSYLFWCVLANVRQTLLVAMEEGRDPYGVMIR
jgi:hypothetical protein